MHLGQGQDHEEELAEEHYSRGRELFQAGKLLEAGRHLQRALELDPDFSLARQLLRQIAERG
jgi:tetratricopeptide (TPR) repeat protein